MINETAYEHITSGTEAGVPYVRLGKTERFDVESIFDCGQAFRFDPVAGTLHEKEYGGVAMGKYISVAQDGGDVTFYGVTERDFDTVWRHYFGFDFDYAAASEDILSRSDVPALAAAVEFGRGIRILRQERWETLCSFIISQNNNIPRIKGLVRNLSRTLGKKIVCDGSDGGSDMTEHGACPEEYAFPTPEDVVRAGIGTLSALKTGFRAPYIFDAAVKAASGELDTDAAASAPTTAEASQILQSVKGVGPKVAACTLLFGFGRMDAFPVDVWIKRVIAKYFPGDFDPAVLGPYAGLAQQYMFFYERGLENAKKI
ncbi:MAG: DNA-3-methyladenine glycosylase 2 family protein [Clostridia bacterium]|nr:DNA-3-methyladenine glycosylase 2 family protein [Clostridia bacterium]